MLEQFQQVRNFLKSCYQLPSPFHLAKLYIAKNDREAAREELTLTYRLARAYSRTKLLDQTVEMLHEIEPDALFRVLLQSRF